MLHKQLSKLVIKRVQFTVGFLLINIAVMAQVYTATLSGPNVSPPNGSAGAGMATITITGNNMRVQCTFSGLTGTVTASHIHAATAVAGTGTAGVATTTPSFIGFPLGVTSGTYDATLDMTSSTSYNPSYITANGGTAALAFNSLKTAMADGKAYFDIHTTVFPGGEIRGFLTAGTLAINLSHFDAIVQNRNSVFLNWKIEQAEANTSFMVQRSTDGQNFTDLNTLVSNYTQLQFSFTDKNLTSGKYFYRLKIIDNQGIVKYSDNVPAKIGADNLLTKIGPNPATTSIGLVVSDANLVNTPVSIYNAQMQVIVQQKIHSNYQQIKLTHLSSGLYFIKFADGSVQKFIKQ